MTEPALLSEREASILRWRCRRGLLENDVFIERFFNTHGSRVSEDQAYGLTLLMNLPDNDLLDLFLRRCEPTGELDIPQVRAVLEQVRQRPPGGLPDGNPIATLTRTN